MAINLKALIGKLNHESRSALEAAAGLCVSRTHYDIEIEHYVTKLLDQADGDFARITQHFGVDKSRLTTELMRSLDKLKTGNARTPALSPSVLEMMKAAWTIGSIDFNAGEIRTGYTVLALVSEPELSRIMRDVSREFQKIEAESLRKDFTAIVAESHEEANDIEAAEPGTEETPRKAGGKTPNLDQYTVNLTENARHGKIDPVLGRDLEIRQIVDILTRRRQNNPILTGEAGVGKTAVVEGFAIRVAQGDVPPVLKNVTIRTLDLALLQAGAGVKGEFENRLKGLIEEVKASPTPIVLFIDEAHTMIGAGGQAGQGDAANLLKPALARGELRTIAATTWSEYKKYFEKDAALARRFQVVKVEEPTEVQCMVMMRGIVASLEKHHGVRILDEAVAAGVRLSNRYLAGRQLPDKAVSVLDTACARLALGQNTTPPAIEDAVRQVDDYEVQHRILSREAAVGVDHDERLEEIRKAKAEVEARMGKLRERWDKERELVVQIREIRGKLEGDQPGNGAGPASSSGNGVPMNQAATASKSATQSAPVATLAPPTTAVAELKPAELRAQLSRLESELSQLQGEAGLIRVCVDAKIVGEVISAWTGIPVGKMMKDEIDTILSLQRMLGNRVIGQSYALEVISQRIQTSRASLDDPNKPVGVFMLVGPSGVGKNGDCARLVRPSIRWRAQLDHH